MDPLKSNRACCCSILNDSQGNKTCSCRLLLLLLLQARKILYREFLGIPLAWVHS